MASKKHLVIETLYDPGGRGITATAEYVPSPYKLQRPSLTPRIQTSLVLIHGLNGDYLNTWTHEETKVCWPKDLLPSVFPRIRVLSLAYDADVYGNTSVVGVRGNAQTLLARLTDLREVRHHGSPIVFVAHSLGGIVLKQVGTCQPRVVV